MLTERDLAILQAVAIHRFLRSSQITKLIAGSRQQILRRLQLLFHHGFLERPRCQIDYYRHGSRPLVYGLSQRGASLLEERFGFDARSFDWTAKNRSVQRYFLEHALAVADVMVAFEIACRQETALRLQVENKKDVRWLVKLSARSVNQAIPVIPDKVFALRDPQRRRSDLHILLEVDRGTMPVMRNTLKQTSLFRKLLGYQQMWRNRMHLDFDLKRIRVLTVTTTETRVANLIQAGQRLKEGSPGLFLFTDMPSFQKASDPFAAIYRNSGGEQIALAE